MPAAPLRAKYRDCAHDHAGKTKRNMKPDNRQKDGVDGWNLDAENVCHCILYFTWQTDRLGAVDHRIGAKLGSTKNRIPNLSPGF
jgi:hypothetical protein